MNSINDVPRPPMTRAALRPTDSKEQPYWASPLNLLCGAEGGHDRRDAAALAAQHMHRQRGITRPKFSRHRPLSARRCSAGGGAKPAANGGAAGRLAAPGTQVCQRPARVPLLTEIAERVPGRTNA